MSITSRRSLLRGALALIPAAAVAAPAIAAIAPPLEPAAPPAPAIMPQSRRRAAHPDAKLLRMEQGMLRALKAQEDASNRLRAQRHFESPACQRAQAAFDRAVDVVADHCERIISTPATTADGMKLKLRAIKAAELHHAPSEWWDQFAAELHAVLEART